MSEGKNGGKDSYFKLLFVPILISLIAGGAAPWWWNNLRGEAPTQEPINTAIPETLELKLNVLTPDNQPLRQVAVMVITNSAPILEFTDRNGYVNIQIPTAKNIDVVLSKEGFQTVRQALDLETKLNKTRKIYMHGNENVLVIPDSAETSQNPETPQSRPDPVEVPQSPPRSERPIQTSESLSQAAQTSILKENFEFTVDGCSRTGEFGVVICNFIVADKAEGRRLIIYANWAGRPSQIIDSRGGVYDASNVEFGSNRSSSTARTELFQNIPVKGSLTFTGVPEEVENINLLSISNYSPKGGYFLAPFREIKILK